MININQIFFFFQYKHAIVFTRRCRIRHIIHEFPCLKTSTDIFVKKMLLLLSIQRICSCSRQVHMLSKSKVHAQHKNMMLTYQYMVFQSQRRVCSSCKNYIINMIVLFLLPSLVTNVISLIY